MSLFGDNDEDKKSGVLSIVGKILPFILSDEKAKENIEPVDDDSYESKMKSLKNRRIK